MAVRHLGTERLACTVRNITVTPEALSRLLSLVAEMGELRERLGRLDAEATLLRQVRAERDRAKALHDEAVVKRQEAEAALEIARAQLTNWTAGGWLGRT